MQTFAPKLVLSLIALQLAISASSSSATTIYTNQSTFLAATQPGYYLETFNSLPQGVRLNLSLAFSMNGFSYTASALGVPVGGFYNVGPSGDTWLSTYQANRNIVFNLTSNNVTAIGGFFFLTDADGNVMGGTVTVKLNDGSVFSLANASSTAFIGFTSAIPILSLTVTPPPYDGKVGIWATVNDLATGMAGKGAAVPERGTSLLLLGLAALGMGVGRHAFAKQNRTI